MPTSPRRRPAALLAALGATCVAPSAAAPARLLAQQPPAARADSARDARDARARRDSAQTLRAVEVVTTASGAGATRGASALLREEVRLSVPAGTTGLKTIERLPGVNVQGADPWGAYEWANRVTIRGFQPQQIGQTFDGITLGDMSYGNFNGLGIGRAVDVENLEATSVAQGSGALGTSSSNNLGGVVQYTSTAPADRRGGQLSQLVGESASRRSFGRFDTGLGSLGSGPGALQAKAFVSASRMDADKWKGSGQRFSPARNALLGQRGLIGEAGEVWQDQLNARADATWGAHAFTAFYNLADRKEADYTDLSLARFQASGRDWDQFASWDAAKQAARSATPDEAYFHSAQGARRDHLGYLRGDFRLGLLTHVVVQPYLHTNRGAGDWHAPSYGATWSPDPIYFRQTQYDTRRWGVNARLSTVLRGNRLEAGLWHENNEANIRRVGWRLRNFESGPEVDFSRVLRLFFDRTGDYQTTSAYVQNTNFLLDDRLRLTYGVKYLRIGADFTNNGATEPGAATTPDLARPNASIPTDGGLLPQLGALFRASETEELFANVATNVNAFPYSPQTGVYNTDPRAFQFFRDNTDPERATTYEAGVRTRRARVEASLAGYLIDYRNRLVGVAVCPLTATCVSSFANVGSVTSRGVEGLVALRLTPGLTWTTSASYNAATVDDDYVAGRDTVRAGGKDVVDAPRLLLNTSGRWTRGGAFVTGGVRHVDDRFFSITNDLVRPGDRAGRVPGYTLVDAGAGWRFRDVAALRELTVQLNVTNLLDEAFVSTIGTGGFTVRGDTQTMMAGARRQSFLTVSTAF